MTHEIEVMWPDRREGTYEVPEEILEEKIKQYRSNGGYIISVDGEDYAQS